MNNRIVKLKIVRNFLDDEYCVQWIEGGKIDEAKCYYTDCKQDALKTMHAIKNENYTIKNNIKIEAV